MTKTTLFNNGEMQVARANGKMQPIIVSDEDKICCCVWDCFWAPCLNTCGMMPHVTGIPKGSKPISDEEKESILKRWEGRWEVQPLPSMAVKGRNKQFYIEYTAAYFDDENVILSGGTSQETRVASGKGKVGHHIFDSKDVKMSAKYTVDAPNEGQVNKLIFFRSPDGKLYIDNIGSYVVSEERGKLKIQTASGWPMTLRRNVSPEKDAMEHD